ncbi:MAG TPA: PIG-L family deacetylase [Bacteroidota bacterium]|nr:PIG-L family deacetylase [Bacteroidota bacterium]
MAKLSHLICGIAAISAGVCISPSPAQTVVTPPPDARFKADILVVVAHPDDESLIAGYLARAVCDEGKRVAVVFATRGDAGQNLVGEEQAHALADVREAEARQALGSIGIQLVWFLRAPDTPYPDVPDVLRSLGTWNHGNVLGEVVRFIRLTRPEVIITMLPDIVVGENHEDHQASGVVATEAFDLAGDPTWFPEQVAAPEDHLWYSNLMEGLRTWQPKKLYYFTDASHTDFLRGKGPAYAMTDVSPTRHASYARLAAEEVAFHRTQYDGAPAHEIAAGSLGPYEQPLAFVLGKSLVGGSVTGDIFQGVDSGPISYRAPRGYAAPSMSHDAAPGRLWIELGGGWAFYARFWTAHGLDPMPGLLAPELGVGSGQDFSVPLILHNDTDLPAVFDLRTRMPRGWSRDSNSAQFAHHALPVSGFAVGAHDAVPVRVRLVAANLEAPAWQEITWTAAVNGEAAGTAALNVFVAGRGDRP